MFGSLVLVLYVVLHAVVGAGLQVLSIAKHTQYSLLQMHVYLKVAIKKY